MLLSLSETRKLLRKYQIPEPPGKLTKTIGECLEACKEIGFPVVLKLISLSVIHKTDVGGVISVDNLKEAKEGFKRIKQIAKRENAKLDGVFVQKMLKGYKVLIGGKLDHDFGPTLAVGWGGIYTEILEDVSFRVCPIDKKDVLEMLKELKVYKLLKKGYRGSPPGNIEALVDVMLKTNRLILNEPIKELDFNPVFVTSEEVLVADPRIILG